jgi:CRISPR-associated protein Csd2
MAKPIKQEVAVAEYVSKNYVVSKAQAATMKAGELENVIIVDDINAVVNLFISGCIYVSAVCTNPQGDIDAGGAPRQNPCNRKGLISSPGYKRKMRDAIQSMYKLPIHVQRRGVLLGGTLEAAIAKGKDPKVTADLKKFVDDQKQQAEQSKKSAKGAAADADADDAEESAGSDAVSSGKCDWSSIKQANREYFWDDRTFGRLFTAPVNDGDTGPVQISHFQTLHPIEILDLAINAPLASFKEKGNNTIGRMSIVDFGLYAGTITVNPRHAQTTGYTWADLNLMLNTVALLWDMSQSATRTGVSHERMYLFVHTSAYGSLPLNQTIKLTRPLDKTSSTPDDARKSMDDYHLPERNEIELPAGMRLIII